MYLHQRPSYMMQRAILPDLCGLLQHPWRFAIITHREVEGLFR